MNGKIKDFTDLDTWKESHKLVLMIYDVTRKFPKEEQFGLVSQMRRSVVSVTSNIAEGFGRQGMKEKIQFYYMSQGSLTELKNQIFIVRDTGLVNSSTIDRIIEQLETAHRLLQGLIRKSKEIGDFSRIQNLKSRI